MSVADAREILGELLHDETFVVDKNGGRVIEWSGASFNADDDHIFGTVNKDYVEKELNWYRSQSLNVNDIPGGPPTIWKQVADKDGFINSNYGWCIFSQENGNQFYNVVGELDKNPDSRRAEMIYTRPSMWQDYNKNGRSDFMCTNAVQYLIRGGSVHSVVQMRSNDVTYGYKNDYAWQAWVLKQVSAALNVPVGTIVWQVGSLHVYERDFYLVHHYNETGEESITKKDYRELYPKSPYLP